MTSGTNQVTSFSCASLQWANLFRTLQLADKSIVAESAIENEMFLTALLTKEILCKFLNLNNSSTWNEPIEMLYACHSKVKRFCQLSILPDYLEKHGYTQAVLNDVETDFKLFQSCCAVTSR